MQSIHEDEREIRELVQTWSSATMAGDLDAILSLMTEDVVFLGAGRPPMIGKASFAEASKTQTAQPFQVSSKTDIQEVEVIGEWAFMWQKLFVAATSTNGDEVIKREGYTLTIFKKERGRWLLARDANMLAIVPNTSE